MKTGPKPNPKARKSLVSLRLSPELKRQVDAYAKGAGIGRGAAIRRLLEVALRGS